MMHGILAAVSYAALVLAAAFATMFWKYEEQAPRHLVWINCGIAKSSEVSTNTATV